MMPVFVGRMILMTLDILKVAKYFLTKNDPDSGDDITHLKLQKLCYYAQAWHLAIENKPLMIAEFEAWAHGPVNRKLWEEYRDSSWNPIPFPTDFNESDYSKEDKEFLNDVWEVYGKFTAKYLENLTHQEDPWLEARGDTPEGEYCDTPISQETMGRYYTEYLNDEE